MHVLSFQIWRIRTDFCWVIKIRQACTSSSQRHKSRTWIILVIFITIIIVKFMRICRQYVKVERRKVMWWWYGIYQEHTLAWVSIFCFPWYDCFHFPKIFLKLSVIINSYNQYAYFLTNQPQISWLSGTHYIIRKINMYTMHNSSNIK